MKIEDIKLIVSQKISNNRFRHSLGVADTARWMAERYGLDADKAFLTGLVHDYGKSIPGDMLLKLADEFGLPLTRVDRTNPDILHAPIGAILLERELGITDPEILRAVKLHTLGDTDMSNFDKVIYLADMIEPGRDFPGIERLRCLAERNLDRAMVAAIESTLRYCMERKRLIHPKSVEVRNTLLCVLPEEQGLW